MNRYDLIGAKLVPPAVQASRVANARPVFHPTSGPAPTPRAPMQNSQSRIPPGAFPNRFPTTFPSVAQPRFFRASRYYRPRYVIQVAAPSPGMVCGAAYIAWQQYAATKNADAAKVAILKRQFEQCLASSVMSPYALPVSTLY